MDNVTPEPRRRDVWYVNELGLKRPERVQDESDVVVPADKPLVRRLREHMQRTERYLIRAHTANLALMHGEYEGSLLDRLTVMTDKTDVHLREAHKMLAQALSLTDHALRARRTRKGGEPR